MTPEYDQLDPLRLCDAVDATMDALVEVARQTGRVPRWPADLMGSAMQPDALRGFTRAEIEEASAFLVRLGAIDAPGSDSVN
ncbi:MAG: hypothetical protein ACF8QF_11595 [Phycisphaerales bacterium]